MTNSLTIGDFSRATHLTVKTLRHYHETGLLVPTHVDPQTSYRRYATEQIQTAQIIRRFRDLDMPLSEIRAVLSASDVDIRNELISAHLKRLEEDLARTQTAVKRRGKLRVRRQIEHAGISPALARRVTDEIFEALDPEALIGAALAKRLRGREVIADDAEFNRLFRYLIGQGFEPERVLALLRNHKRQKNHED